MIKVAAKISPELAAFGVRAKNAPAWVPRIIGQKMRSLGKYVVEHMRDQVDHNRYTGRLQRSIRAVYDAAQMELAVHPTVQRGNYDGGEILERGTRPIPNAPWGPIARWSRFRGIPAFPVWFKIRTRGVAAHPFLAPTLHRSQGDIAEAGTWMITLIDGRLMGTSGGAEAGGETYAETDGAEG